MLHVLHIGEAWQPTIVRSVSFTYTPHGLKHEPITLHLKQGS